MNEYKEGRGDYYLAEGKREEQQQEMVYVGPIQHEQGAGVGMCDCWCARCDSPKAVVRAEFQRRWTVVAGMPWPASCRHCDLVTEDPDAYFLPTDWDEDDLPWEARCPAADYEMAHEVRTLDDFRLVLSGGGMGHVR